MVFVGGALLLWASIRARSQVRLVAWSCASVIALLFGSQIIAVATGLASGRTEMGGWSWYVVLAATALYIFSVAALGVGGILLLVHLFRAVGPESQTAPDQ